jgi:ShK domain-like
VTDLSVPDGVCVASGWRTTARCRLIIHYDGQLVVKSVANHMQVGVDCDCEMRREDLTVDTGRSLLSILSGTMHINRLVKSLLGLLLIACSVEGQACSDDGICDTHERCAVWKEEGECIRSPEYMREHCPVACTEMDTEISTEECEDRHVGCSEWAQLGECDKNPEMEKYCSKSCETCDLAGLCRDTHEHCEFWASLDECSTNPKFMLRYCPQSCGTCDQMNEDLDSLPHDVIDATTGFGVRQLVDGLDRDPTLEIIHRSIEYMTSEEVQSLSGKFKKACRNVHELCSFWASIGECEANQVRSSGASSGSLFRTLECDLRSLFHLSLQGLHEIELRTLVQ